MSAADWQDEPWKLEDLDAYRDALLEFEIGIGKFLEATRPYIHRREVKLARTVVEGLAEAIVFEEERAQVEVRERRREKK